MARNAVNTRPTPGAAGLPAPWPWLAWLLALMLVLVAHPAAGQSPDQAPTADPAVVLVDERPAIPLWQAVTVLRDPEQRLSAAEALALRHHYAPPEGTPGNLGRSADVIWLRVLLRVPGQAHGTPTDAARPARAEQARVLEIDYAPLNEVDAWLWHDGALLAGPLRAGNLRPQQARSRIDRAVALPLLLPPGESELLLRVRSDSTLVLPLVLRTEASHAEVRAGSQLVLGVTLGLALCMLLYAGAHGFALKDRIFGFYALMLLGNAVFLLNYFGIADRYLWTASPQLTLWASPIAVLVAVAAGCWFIHDTLAAATGSRIASLALRGIAALALGGIVLSLGLAVFGLRAYPLAQTLATVLGVAAMLCSVPLAWLRARQGDRGARFMLAGWLFYAGGSLTIAAMLRGWVEPTLLVRWIYPLAAMAEMTAWMGVLALRVQLLQRQAERSRAEGDTLRRLAHTDALTGLPNRRGLQERLQVALPAAGPGRLVALYLLDLDGFKPVNDQHGHDVGDALLAAVGQRLKAPLRAGDTVSRLGGDEFVVLAEGLPDEAAARCVAGKLLAAVNEPFEVCGHRVSVGLTVGYALAPLDGTRADDLLKRADAAMYTGKRSGGQRIQRGGRSGSSSLAELTA